MLRYVNEREDRTMNTKRNIYKIKSALIWMVLMLLMFIPTQGLQAWYLYNAVKVPEYAGEKPIVYGKIKFDFPGKHGSHQVSMQFDLHTLYPKIFEEDNWTSFIHPFGGEGFRRDGDPELIYCEYCFSSIELMDIFPDLDGFHIIKSWNIHKGWDSDHADGSKTFFQVELYKIGSQTALHKAELQLERFGDPNPDKTMEPIETKLEPTCPCRVWADTWTPSNPNEQDDDAVEVGVKFISEKEGYIESILFFKGNGNTGVHVGNLWTSKGELLSSATFENETGYGWQKVNFDPPVPIEANTVYVASYYAPNGHYANDNGDFAWGGIYHSAGSLRFLDDGESGPNGVYMYSESSAFPKNGYSSTNYWVDVIFIDHNH